MEKQGRQGQGRTRARPVPLGGGSAGGAGLAWPGLAAGLSSGLRPGPLRHPARRGTVTAQQSPGEARLSCRSYAGSYLQQQRPTAMQNSDWLASDHVSDSSQ